MKTVKVTLTTAYKPNGVSHLVKARTKIEKVACEYLGGKVQTQSGDVWSVIPNPNQQESTYIAIA